MAKQTGVSRPTVYRIVKD
nr:hypothetical protein [Staphylococcus nepalensis]